MESPTDVRIWDRIAARYSRAPIKDEASYRRKLSMTADYMRPEMRVLELGCGTGGTATLHAHRVREIVAVDFSAKMLAIAEARARDAGVTNIEFRQSSVEDFDAGDQRFDIVLALSLLHLLKDRDAAIAKIRTLLKPGGIFVSSTACLAEHHGFLRYLEPLGRRLGLLPRIGIFSQRDLRASVEGAGFSIEEYWVPEAKKAHVVFIVARSPDD